LGSSGGRPPTRPAGLKELAWLLAFRSEGRALRASAATDAGADGTRAERGSIFGVGIVPTDGTRLQIVGSGEFGMSPFFGQL
jgi:hypothetical protein